MLPPLGEGFSAVARFVDGVAQAAQVAGEQCAVGVGVVCHEHHRCGLERSGRFHGGEGCALHWEGQLEGDASGGVGCGAARLAADDREVAAQEQRQAAADTETHPQAQCCGCRGGVGQLQPRKVRGQLFRRQRAARTLDPDRQQTPRLQIAAHGQGGDMQRQRAGRCAFDGVADHVVENLLQLVAVRHDPIRRGVAIGDGQIDLTAFRCQPEQPHRLIDQRAQRNGARG